MPQTFNNGDVTAVTVPAVTSAIVDFGKSPTSSEDTTTQAIVLSSLVGTTDIIVCTVIEGQDHTADEIAAEQITATAGSIVVGVSFEVTISAPNGASGKFYVSITG